MSNKNWPVMRNPFTYGGVVGGEAFCNREEEMAHLQRTIDNAGRLFLYGERRLGKTSLIKHLLDDLPGDEYISAYVDLWPTDSRADFTTALAKSIVEATSTTAEKLLRTARQLFSQLRPAVTIDESGAPVLTFDTAMSAEKAPELDEVLNAPARVAADTDRRVAIVFDEFQQILEFGSETVERRLRSTIQHHQDVAYLFLGSRKHVIQEMFLNSDRPLYRSAEHYPLGPIAAPHWHPFIRERFSMADKEISEECLDAVFDLTEGHPFYVQHLCHVLWERCPRGEAVTERAIAEAVDVLLSRESYAYTALWESLTRNQRRLLTGLAVEAPDVALYSAAFVQRYRLKSPSNVQRALNALLERDLIDRENGSHIVLDRFFRLWIRRQHE